MIKQRCDFYILGQDNLIPFTVKLINKAYEANLRVQVLVDDEQKAAMLDQQLWTFKETSFIPHARTKTELAEHAPIVIGPLDQMPTTMNPDSIVNLTGTVPSSLQSIQRLLEVIPPDPTQQQSARQRYKAYQSHGFEIHTHKIGS